VGSLNWTKLSAFVTGALTDLSPNFSFKDKTNSFCSSEISSTGFTFTFGFCSTILFSFSSFAVSTAIAFSITNG
jgi:hypothetical protein